MLCCPRLPPIHWTVRPLEPLPPDERTSYPVQRRASVLHPQEYLLHRQGVAPVPVCPIPDSNLVRPHRQESVRIPLGRQRPSAIAICIANQAQAVVTIYIFSGILEIGLKTKCRRQDLLFSSNLVFCFSTAFTHKMPHTAEQTLAHLSPRNS